jgi:hypothetical protein
MSTTEVSSSHFGEKTSPPASFSAKIKAAEEKVHILPEKTEPFTLRVLKTCFADLRAARPI